jgi:arsenate reductase (thioredoxin)
MPKPIILILCTGNSGRSQMADGILRAAAGDILDVRSAGTRPAGFVHPLAVRALAELGIDLSQGRSKSVDEFKGEAIDTVITVCGGANEECPVFPGRVKRYHWGFDDPAKATGSDEEKMAEFRRVRDEIKLVFEAFAAGCRVERI